MDGRREVRNGGKYEMAGRLVVRNGGKNDMAGSIRYCSHCSRHFVLLPQKNNMNAHSYYFLSYSCRIATDGRMDGWMDGRLLALEYHWFLAPSSKNERSVVPSVVRPSVGVGRIPKIPIMSLPLLFHLGNSYNPVGRPRGSYQNSNSFPCWLFHFSFLLFVSLFQYIEFPHLNTDTYVGLSSPCFLLRRLESICFLVFHPPFLVAPSRLIPPAARASFFPSRYHGWTDDTTPL